MTTSYANKTTPYFDERIAAQMAGGDKIDLAGGTLVVGDGNGATPAISDLIAADGVTHEVWRGQVIQGVVVDPNALNQIDISVDIPATSGGAEIGPFTVREFAILDAAGHCCVVGTTNLEKTIASQGQISDLAWMVGVGVASTDAVIITPPNAGFATMAMVIAGVNANLPDCTAPLTKSDTPQPSGWLRRVFGIAPASQPNDAVTIASSAAAMGAGRPASAAEYAAGAAIAGFAWPWPTLQQVKASLTAVASALAALADEFSGYLPLLGGTMQGPINLAADPTAVAHAATKRYVDAKFAGVSVPDISGLLPKSGGIMSGPLSLAGDPTVDAHAATKHYVDAAVAPAEIPIGGTQIDVQSGTNLPNRDTVGSVTSIGGRTWVVISCFVFTSGMLARTISGGSGGTVYDNVYVKITQYRRTS